MRSREVSFHLAIFDAGGLEGRLSYIPAMPFLLSRSCGSTDNFSVVVVDLKSCGNQEAKSGRYEP